MDLNVNGKIHRLSVPIICIAPAIGNAIFNATGKRLRDLPMRLG